MRKIKLTTLVGILITVGLITGLSINIFSRKNATLLGTQKTIKVNGTLKFELDPGQHKKGETFSVNILVNSDGQAIAGADILIKYDQDILEVAQQGKLVETEKDFFVIFPANGQNKENLFQFSVLTQKPQVLSGKIATVYFFAKESGEAELEFFFEKGKTSDSNLALAGQGADILASVGNAFLKIMK